MYHESTVSFFAPLKSAEEEGKRVASARKAGNGPTEVATEVEEVLREDWDQVSQEAAADTP